MYADIALALHYASVAKDRHSVHFHLRRLRPQLKKAFYFQQQQQQQLRGYIKPLHHVSLHHIDLISDPTDTVQLEAAPTRNRGSFNTGSYDMSSSETAVTAREMVVGDGPDVFYDIECNGDPIAAAEEPEMLSAWQEDKKRKKERRKSCCGCDMVLETSDSDSSSMVS